MGDRQNVCTSTQAARKQEKWQQSRENYWRQSELAAEPDSDQIVRIRIKKMRKVWFQNWKGVFFVAVQTKCNSSSYQFRLKICLASCIHSLADARKKNVGRIASWKKRHLTAGKDPRIFNPLIQLLHHYNLGYADINENERDKIVVSNRSWLVWCLVLVQGSD